MHNEIKGELRQQVALARHTSWQIGGIAKQYYKPVDIADLANFLQWLPATEPVFWLGHGSNVLIADSGFAGTVLHIRNTLNSIELQVSAAETLIRIEAGATCVALAKFCQQHGMVGAEFYAGIPGTFGGALAMNAGAFGGETWPHVVQVETINRQGQRLVRLPAEFVIGYRKVIMPQPEWFTAALLRFAPGDVAAARATMLALLQTRKDTQPINELTCGSVFCNPPGHHAAQLIESAGLKGLAIGGAIVSTKHANFIVNQGGASAHDVNSLISLVQRRVWEVHQVQLVTEVRVIGDV